MDKYQMDGQKLSYHVDRVADWQRGENVYPVYIEMSPAGACNHRCRFCAKDFIGYQSRNLEWDMIRERLEEMGRLGVRSIMHAGEGEPLLNKHIVGIVQTGRAAGIDQAINTNGVLLTPDVAAQLLPHLEWLRVSLDAATADVHKSIHVTHGNDFDKIIHNLREAVRLKKENNWRCTLGFQMVLLPENRHQVKALAELARDVGVDYLAVKPYSQNPHGIAHEFEEVNYENDLHMAAELEAYNTENFQVIFRVNAMKKWDTADRSYQRCSAMAFWTYIDAGGSVWGCCNHHGDERFYLGCLYENSFQEIWEGEKRLQMMDWASNEFDISKCRINCRMDEVNRYLWSVKHPPNHVNFI
jgi:radical SAM protein with 4Fe4S-binding SPASM domain